MKVEFEHYRVHCNVDCCKGKPEPGYLQRYYRGGRKGEELFYRWAPRSKGGATVCTVTLESGEQFSGTAFCSMGDTFCYSTGREIALKRAMRRLLDAVDLGVLPTLAGKISIVASVEDAPYLAAALKSALGEITLTKETKTKLRGVYERLKVFKPVSQD